MKALTVEEYEFLGDEPGSLDDEPADYNQLSTAAQCVEFGWLRKVNLDDEWHTWENTADGDRAVRVHRVFLASMGG